MTPKQIINKVRMNPAIADNQGDKYSDYQVIDALNNVLAMTYNTIAASSSTIMNRTADIHIKNGHAELPDDFLKVVSVKSGAKELHPVPRGVDIPKDGYQISADTIYSPNDTLTIEYKPYFDEDITMDTLEDDLDIPAYFVNLLVKYTVVTLLGATTKDADVIQQITTDIYNITASREYSYLVDNALPWKV